MYLEICISLQKYDEYLHVCKIMVDFYTLCPYVHIHNWKFGIFIRTT